MGELHDPHAETAAEYLLHLERMVAANYFGVREALQKAFQAGETRGAIRGIESAKEIYQGTKP